MKLYMILYTMHGIGGVWGPLPYDAHECLQRIAVWQVQTDTVAATGIGVKGNTVPPDAQAELQNWRMACELHALTPQLSGGEK